MISVRHTQLSILHLAKRAKLEWPVEDQAIGHTANELLQVGQYEQVSDLLHSAQVVSEQKGNAILALVLAVAHHISLASSQCRDEAEWYRQIYEQARQREDELKQQLCAILSLIGGCETPELLERPKGTPGVSTVKMDLSGHGFPGSLEHFGLWHRSHGPPGSKPPSRLSGKAESPVAPLLAPGHDVATALPVDKEKRKNKTPPSMAVCCLGPFQVSQNDQLIADWDSLKGQLIFKYLVTHRDRPVAKDILMDVFWPDADPEAARRNLHQAVYSLRQILKRRHPDFQHIKFENDCYSLHPEMKIWLDYEAFEKHARTGRRLEAAGQLAAAMVQYGIAEGLYQGDFLAELLYEDWPRLQREHIRSKYLEIADCLGEYYVQRGEYAAAIALCQKILTQDNCCEKAHRRLMQCYQAQGQRHLAVRQYQTCAQALQEELDLAPSDETLKLYQRIAASA